MDDAYFNYIADKFNVESTSMIAQESNPINHLKGFRENQLNTTDLTVPPGKYARPLPNRNFWVQNASAGDLTEFAPRGQGWKIHISALPHSALKIAQLLLPQINNVPFQKNAKVFYKIIGSLPLMRTLWYVYGKVKGQESQPGKFLVIYSENPAHAYELVKKIDQIFMAAKKQGFLKDEDFYPLVGDAQVGQSGWIYVRYGRYTAGQVKKLDPLEATMHIGLDESISLYQDDDRFHPWPDFMNKKNQFWKSQPSPFQDLPLKWTSMNKGKTITWQTRPKSWWDFEQTELEKSDLEKSAKLFDQKDEEDARHQQIEADRLLAEKLQQEERETYEKEQQQIKEDEKLARQLQGELNS